MNFFRKNWYRLCFLVFIGLAYFMTFWGIGIFSHIQVILVYSFMALLLHQVEEYWLPGGFPMIFNYLISMETIKTDRYPINQNSSFIINGILAPIFYITAIFLPDLIWLGLAQVLFGVLQIFFHGIFLNVKMRTLYNPGLGAVVFLHVPIAIYYIYYVTANNLLQATDVVYGLIGLVAAAILTAGLPIRIFGMNKQNRFPFSADEMERFQIRERIAKKGIRIK